jgi:hypothetical protein
MADFMSHDSLMGHLPEASDLLIHILAEERIEGTRPFGNDPIDKNVMRIRRPRIASRTLNTPIGERMEEAGVVLIAARADTILRDRLLETAGRNCCIIGKNSNDQ